MLSLRVHAHSEVGRVRKNNQDAGYASPTLLLVADGMGGAAAGDLASAVAATEASKADARAVDGEEMLGRAAGIVGQVVQRHRGAVAGEDRDGREPDARGGPRDQRATTVKPEGRRARQRHSAAVP